MIITDSSVSIAVRDSLCQDPLWAQSDLFPMDRPPVIIAYGGGVNSTAMLIEMIERGEPVDAILFADTGTEKPETYQFLKLFGAWLAERGHRIIVVRYQPKNYKSHPAYRTLLENCLVNGTLPSISFGFSSCSLKWKVHPQEAWARTWAPAVACWGSGQQVIKVIGYDCSPRDKRRYAEREGYEDPRYVYRYYLRECGWDREDCIARILKSGLPVPLKSACRHCAAMKPVEVDDLSVPHLGQNVLVEARAKPRLHTVEGLWRSTVKGCRGAVPHPGSMTLYIREKGLLSASSIEAIETEALPHLLRWLEDAKQRSVRPEMGAWLDRFNSALDALQAGGRREQFSRILAQV